MKKQTKQLAPIIENKLSSSQEQKLAEMMPNWVPEKENIGTAMYQTAQEFLELVEELLKRHHGWGEKQIIQLESELKETLPILHEMERKGLSILSPIDMAKVGEIAEIRKQRLERGKSGIALPSDIDFKKLK